MAWNPVDDLYRKCRAIIMVQDELQRTLNQVYKQTQQMSYYLTKLEVSIFNLFYAYLTFVFHSVSHRGEITASLITMDHQSGMIFQNYGVPTILSVGARRKKD